MSVITRLWNAERAMRIAATLAMFPTVLAHVTIFCWAMIVFGSIAAMLAWSLFLGTDGTPNSTTSIRVGPIFTNRGKLRSVAWWRWVTIGDCVLGLLYAAFGVIVLTRG